MKSNVEMCACGSPLHYSDPGIQKQIERLIEQLGPTLEIAVIGNSKKFKVPRHYIALHGIKATELEDIAMKHGFEEIRQ